MKHKFCRHQEHKESFKNLKKILTTPPLLLKYPHPTAEFILATDASEYAIGGALKQVIDETLTTILTRADLKHALGKYKQISIASLHDARTNSMVSHPCEKGEVLNRYFAEVCTPLNTQGHIFPTLPTPKQIMPTFTIDVNEVYYSLKKINVMKAVAPGISGRILKEDAFELTPVLTRLFNHSLSMETFPSQWKLGFVTVIFKQGDVHHPTNYRPITLLSAVSKIFERVIFKRVFTFLIKAREISPNQSGFLPSHSTITQLVQMLASKGIRGSLLGWFCSYLNERNIVTMVEGFTSSSARIGCGVPQ
ncbi:unnamed protein product, partial [Didymodactylos carnosus]